VLDDLLLPARVCLDPPALLAADGDEVFAIEALEARFYELVSATVREILALERAHYRLLRRAADFVPLPD
jgi:hypothetical protein